MNLLHSCFKDTYKMRLFRWTIGAVLALSAISLFSVPSRADGFPNPTYASSGVRGGSETVSIYDSALNLNNGYYTSYYTYLSASSTGSNPVYYNTFCVDMTHETSSIFSALNTPTPQLTSSYSGGVTPALAYNPGTVSDSSLGVAAWLVNTYYSSATSADQQAGLQIAIWKVLYNTDQTASGLENLGGGSIQFSNNAGALSWALTYITDLVTASNAAGLQAGTYLSSSAYLVNYISSDPGKSDDTHNQYQLITCVPEPSTLAIACLGVIGFAGYGLKRSRRRA